MTKALGKFLPEDLRVHRSQPGQGQASKAIGKARVVDKESEKLLGSPIST